VASNCRNGIQHRVLPGAVILAKPLAQLTVIATHLIDLCVMKEVTHLTLFVLALLPACLAQEKDSPKVFSDGFIKTYNGISFSPDQKTLYTSFQIQEKNLKGNFQTRLFESHLKNGRWTKPVLVAFAAHVDAYHPNVSADGEKIFFNALAPLPIDTIPDIHWNIWYVSKTNTGYSDPAPVPGINTAFKESYPCVVKNGNLYFTSDRPGGAGGRDFYVAPYEKGRYLTPVNISELNSADDENDLAVSPDERFVIFNRYSATDRSMDLFISYRDGLKWTQPKPLTSINSKDTYSPTLAWELTPTLSPDRKVFFYEMGHLIWQVSLSSLLDDR
jgi:hypothetical protein